MSEPKIKQWFHGYYPDGELDLACWSSPTPAHIDVIWGQGVDTSKCEPFAMVPKSTLARVREGLEWIDAMSTDHQAIRKSRELLRLLAPEDNDD